MSGPLTRFLLCSLSIWAILTLPAIWIGGNQSLIDSATAQLLCLIPSAATLAWSQRSFRGSSWNQLRAMLVGSAVRMFTVLTCVLILGLTVRFFQHAGFFVWVIVFYLITLAIEIPMMLALVKPGMKDRKTASMDA